MRVRKRLQGLTLPVFIFGNIPCLRSKSKLMNSQLDANGIMHTESSFINMIETWLEQKDGDGTVNIDGYHLWRSDRRDTIKQHGGGVCASMNDRWCKQILVTVKEFYCDNDVEY